MENGQIGNRTQQLEDQFRSNEVEVFAEAARAIANDPELASRLLEEFLTNPTTDTDRRHGVALLGALMSRRVKAGESLGVAKMAVLKRSQGAQEVHLENFVARWLTDIVFRGCVNSAAGDVVTLPLAVELRQQLSAELRERIANFDRVGSSAPDGATESLRTQIAKLESRSEDAAELIGKALRPPKKKRPFDDDEPWCFSSFFLGADVDLLHHFEIPVSLIAEACIALASEGEFGKPGWVKQLAKVVAEAEESGQLDHGTAQSLHRKLIELAQRFADPASDPSGHWAEIIRVLGGAQAIEPEELARLYAGWRQSRDEGSAIRLARACLNAFCPETEWHELPALQQRALHVFCEVVTYSAKGSAPWKIFTLDHRIRLLADAIEQWHERNELLIPPFARALRVLFDAQRHELSPESERHIEVCRSQVLMAAPLIGTWKLRSLIQKDLGIILVNALSDVYDFCLRTDVDKEHYRKILYTVLYSVPHLEVLNKMLTYAKSGHPVHRHLSCLAMFLESLRDERQAKVEQGRAESVCESSLVGALNLYADFVGLVWKDAPFRGADLTSLMSRVCADSGRTNMVLVQREAVGSGMEDFPGGAAVSISDRERLALNWLMKVRERAKITASLNRSDAGTGGPHAEDLDREVRFRSRLATQSYERLIEEVLLEGRSVRDSTDAADAVAGIRRAIRATAELQSTCRELLPLAERELAARVLRQATRDLERRLDDLSQVGEAENEDRALQILHSPGARDAVDREMVTRWMLKRLMLRDLVEDSPLLSKLVSLRWAIGWILAPYLVVALLHVILGRHQVGACNWHVDGLPFLVALVGNLVLLGLVMREGKAIMPEGIQPGLLLLPQMMGAMFLGLMDSLQADESWTLAYLGNPLLRGFNILLFGVAAFLFVKLALLQGQNPQPRPDGKTGRVLKAKEILNRRARSVMAIGLWQSFLLTMVFSVLMAFVMSGPSRADLPQSPVDSVSNLVGSYVPHAVTIELGGIFNRIFLKGDGPLLELVILPWAILVWTVKLFFFSAIFQRIMSRYGD